MKAGCTIDEVHRERFTTIGKYSQSARLLTADYMEALTVKPSRGKLLLKVFGGSALLLAILFALGEIGAQFGH